MKWMIAVVAVCVFGSVAHAEPWTHTTEFKYADSTQIRVVEPEGFTVEINGKQDTVPAVFKLDNEDNYIVVKMIAKSGAEWSKKIEVKADKETILRVKYNPPVKAEEPQPAKKDGRRFIGRVKNTTDKCKRSDRFHLRFDFMLDGKVQRSEEVHSGKWSHNVELAGGKYDVRIYAYAKNDWLYWRTNTLEVSKDGWEISIGC